MHRFKKSYACIWVIILKFRRSYWTKLVIKNNDNSNFDASVYKVGVMMNDSKTISYHIIADYLNPT